MRNRYIVAAFLVAGLFSARILLGATEGGIRGRVLVNLQALEGIPLTLVNVATGQTYSVRTGRDGASGWNGRGVRVHHAVRVLRSVRVWP